MNGQAGWAAGLPCNDRGWLDHHLGCFMVLVAAVTMQEGSCVITQQLLGGKWKCREVVGGVVQMPGCAGCMHRWHTLRVLARALLSWASHHATTFSMLRRLVAKESRINFCNKRGKKINT